jgi:D-beta-D-heptose 7-phosphate kinase/D-beta-D-heptose 1-phosphate adenosyltransferase
VLDTFDLSALIERLPGSSVTVVGDVMLDRMISGDITRISSEAPIPILKVAREIAMPGGAGNVVRNLTALGTAVAFVSVVGDDQAGADLTGLIGGQPNVEPWLLVEGGRTTTRKTRFLSKNQQVMRVDREQTDPIDPKVMERLLRIVRDAISATNVTVLSDYGKGVLAGDTANQLIAVAHQAGRTVIVDPRGEDYSRYAGADVVTPNRTELAQGSGMDVSSLPNLVRAAQTLRERYGFGAVLVTRGPDGMSLIDESVTHIPALTVDVVDSAGVGDTVTAALAACLASGATLLQAMHVANAAAGYVVGRPGTAVALAADIQRLMTR